MLFLFFLSPDTAPGLWVSHSSLSFRLKADVIFPFYRGPDRADGEEGRWKSQPHPTSHASHCGKCLPPLGTRQTWQWPLTASLHHALGLRHRISLSAHPQIRSRKEVPSYFWRIVSLGIEFYPDNIFVFSALKSHRIFGLHEKIAVILFFVSVYIIYSSSVSFKSLV